MKKGKSIQELSSTLLDIKDNMHDYIAPLSKLTMEVAENTDRAILTMENDSLHQFNPTPWAHQQIATFTGIPKNYYDRITGENPGLLASSVNHGLQMAINRKVADSRMVRTVGDNVRAVLSPRYRRLDCYDLLENIWEDFEREQLEIVSSEITDRRLYLKALSPRLKADVKVGDTVQHGLVISSSDVGCGSVRVEPLILRLVCLNGMISNTALRKFHVGRLQGSDNHFEILSDKTKDLGDAAFWSEVRDVVLNSLRPEVFQAEVDKLKASAETEIRNLDIPKVVELTSKELGVTRDTTKKSVLSYLAKGADGAGLTKWGLANAFTYAAQAEDIDYEEATDLERAGSKVVEMSRRDWDKITA